MIARGPNPAMEWRNYGHLRQAWSEIRKYLRIVTPLLTFAGIARSSACSGLPGMRPAKCRFWAEPSLTHPDHQMESNFMELGIKKLSSAVRLALSLGTIIAVAAAGTAFAQDQSAQPKGNTNPAAPQKASTLRRSSLPVRTFAGLIWKLPARSSPSIAPQSRPAAS